MKLPAKPGAVPSSMAKSTVKMIRNDKHSLQHTSGNKLQHATAVIDELIIAQIGSVALGNVEQVDGLGVGQ